MKKIILIVTSILAGITLLTQPVSAKTLNIGIVNQNHTQDMWTPQTEFNKQLAHQLAKKIKIKYYTPKQSLKALKQHQIDVVLGYNKYDLPHKYSYTHPYMTVRNILFTVSDSKYTNINKLQGKRVGVLKNSQQDSLTQQLLFKQRYYNSIQELVSAIINHKVKAGLLTDYQYTNYLKHHPELVEKANDTDDDTVILTRISDSMITSQSIVAVTYHNTKLNNQMDKTIKKLHDNLWLSKLSNKYFQKDLSHE